MILWLLALSIVLAALGVIWEGLGTYEPDDCPPVTGTTYEPADTSPMTTTIPDMRTTC